MIVPFELNPPIKFGNMTLSRNPTNYFAETENVAFASANTVKGICVSVPDALLQWRLMAYDDTATHRPGSPNYNQLPINWPLSSVHNNERDGYMPLKISSGYAAISPNSIGGVLGVSEQSSYGWLH
jgi:catalase